MRWPVLKTLLYSLVGGRNLQVYCGGEYLSLFCTGLGGAIFSYTALDSTEDCFIQVGVGSSLQVHCSGLY